jgi:diguanylate cyclase
MSSPGNPSEITREALRLLAARRLAPTPDNFRSVYNEIAGISGEGDALPARYIRSIAERLPRDTAERSRLARDIDTALADNSIERAEQALFALLDSLDGAEPPAWNKLISDLLRQWEGRQLGWTPARKRESLQRVLAANEPVTLYKRLQGLIKGWSTASADPEIPAKGEDEQWQDQAAATPVRTTATPVAAPSPDAEDLSVQLRELVCIALDSAVPAFLGEHPDLVQEATNLATEARKATTTESIRTIGTQLRKFAYRLELTASETGEIRAGLLKLLQLLLENIDEIVIDDQWLKGQIETLREVVAQPTNVRRIEDAERRLKDVIYRQSQLKHNLEATQRGLRDMLAGFIDQLADLTETTGSYHDKIASHATRIARVKDIGEIGPVLDEVMRDTRYIQEETRRSRLELATARDKARESEARIAELQHELATTSQAMRHDQLTGVLNRRGLEETFEKECARALRNESPLCVALLDIDNFKRLNDTYGHQTGDDALVHLTTVVRTNLRPADTVARLGGEEFIILYPDSDLEQATAALVRLQRQLTKAFFLAEGGKILITFSAGVSPWTLGEPLEAVLKRADEAMYEAKSTGKNRVVARESSV